MSRLREFAALACFTLMCIFGLSFGQEPTKQPGKEPDKKVTQEPDKKPAQEPEKKTGKEPDKQPSKEPEKKTDQEPEKKPAQPVEKQVAHVKVLVPANAQLLIDDYVTKEQTGTERWFTSPPLPVGKKYTYTLKAIWLDGPSQKVTMAVATVEPGKETMVDLTKEGSRIVYVPTPQEVVDKMLELAKVKKEDIVFDLGCGDGRIVATAAKKFGAKGVGVDIDPERIKDSKETLKKMQVPDDLVDIRQGDALKVPDLSKATVVMLYMLPEFMTKLQPILEKDLKPGTRVVAHDYAVPDWKALETIKMTSSRAWPHTLYVYEVGVKKEEKK